MATILKQIATLGLTIVAVVHQPRQEIFDSFDDLLLIAPGGLTAYLGPRDAALDYFKNQVCCVLGLLRSSTFGATSQRVRQVGLGFGLNGAKSRGS